MKREILGAAALVLGAAVALVACSDSVTDPGRPHTVTLTASPTSAQVGDSIEFFLAATGALLQGVAIEFGDGAADTTATSGAVTVGVRRSHAYSEAGTYMAIGTSVDGTSLGLEEKKDTVEVQITATAGP